VLLLLSQQVLDHRQEKYGSFQRDTYWLRGHVRPEYGTYNYIHGLTGPETKVVIEKIVPIATFEGKP